MTEIMDYQIRYQIPCDRNLRDVELISCRLRRVEPLCRLPGSALQQLAMCGFYEDLEKGVTLFRAGEQGRFWYAVLGGSLEVRYHAHADADGKVSPYLHQSGDETSWHTIPPCAECETMRVLSNIIDSDYSAYPPCCISDPLCMLNIPGIWAWGLG
ncbi:GM20847 [Drosophila sechellia]|uniref:GM20847 n=1 Tax=Drosophila sechellia TaxID=7238 RepID=B4HQC3_DROSE|nr:GM20847 [Drosophila sechellia]